MTGGQADAASVHSLGARLGDGVEVVDTRRAVGGGEQPADRHEVGLEHAQKPVELGDRLGVVVGAQVDVEGTGAPADQERRRLPTPPVAAGRVARGQGGDQAVLEGQVAAVEKGLEGALGDLGAGQRVAGHADARAAAMPGPVGAVLAGEGRAGAVAVHQVQLPHRAAGVAVRQRPGGAFRRGAVRQQIQPGRSQPAVHHRLRGDRPDAGPDMGNQRPDREEKAGHGNAKRLALRGLCNDRPGHLRLTGSSPVFCSAPEGRGPDAGARPAASRTGANIRPG